MSYEFGVVLLAAGRSRRMGRPKMLLPWRGTTVIGYLIGQWRELRPAQLAVVLATGDKGLENELRGLGFPPENRIENPDPDLGMFSSVQCAARWPGWEPGLTHWAIVLGDQPQLLSTTLKSVLALSANHPGLVCQPTFGGHRKHPVVLPESVFKQAAQSTAESLKDFLEGIPAQYCALDDPGLDLDLDHPEDYEKAVKKEL